MKIIKKKRLWVLTKNGEIWEQYIHNTKKGVIEDIDSHLGQFFYNSVGWKNGGYKISIAYLTIEFKKRKNESRKNK